MKKPVSIKICGMTNESEICKMNELQVDYAGFILYYEKSKRNLSIERASELKAGLAHSKAVAVTVSPTLEQLKKIEAAGFDVLQVHGVLFKDVLENCNIELWRALNVSKCDESEIKEATSIEKVTSLVIDGSTPGAGETFDWSAFMGLDTNGKRFIMAGGLNPKNVNDAINTLNPDVVDVSSGVEFEDKSKVGKDLSKMEAFVEAVRM